MLRLADRRPGATPTFVAAMLLAALIGAGAALAESPTLVDLLVVPPLLAAGAASPARTGVVGATSGVLAALAGLSGSAVGSQEHLFPIFTVLLAGGVSVALAQLRAQRESESSRLEIQYTVARALSEADTLKDAAPLILEAVGRPLGWAIGGLWEVRQPRVLRCVHSWYAPGVDPAGFDKLSRQFVFRPGVGLPGRVWETGRPAVISDVTGDEDFSRAEIAARAGLRGAVGFTIRTGAGTVGVIEFFAREVGAPDAQLLETMAAVGSQVGEFMEAARAEEGLRASEARKGAMLQSALDCVVTMDHEGRIVEFNPAAERTFGFAEADVLGRELGEVIVPPALRAGHRAGLARYLETGEARVLGRRLELSGLRADGTEIPVELAISRISGYEPPMFTGYIRDISERLQAEAERERLLELEQVARLDATQARDQLEAILRGVADGVTAQAPDGSLVFANQAAVEQMGYASAAELMAAPPASLLARFDLFDERGDPFSWEHLPGRRALGGETASEIVRFRAVETGDERWSLVKASPIRDEQGNVVMAINVIEDVTSAKRAEQAQSFLAEASALLSSSLDFDATVQRVAELAVPEIADYCVVDVMGEGGVLGRAALAHVDPERVGLAEELARRYPPDPASETGPAHVVRSGAALLFAEIDDRMLVAGATDERHLELLRGLGLRSAMVAPMVARGRSLGAITFVAAESGRRFDESDLELAEELGRRTGIAVDNARLYRDRSHIAKTLQESLLPAQLPEIPGFTTAARFRATGAGTDVGGDFYDLFESGGGRWTVTIGDVCGKGPDAAAVTALARYTLRAVAMSERLPSRTLGSLNEAMLRQRGDMRFCTVAYGVLDPSRNGRARLSLACAGHPPPLLLQADGSVRELGEPGTLLGVVPDPDLPDSSTDIEPGDTVVFYTDGVTEARGPHGSFGPAQLAELLASSAGLDPDAIAGRIEDAAMRTGDGEPRDDIAVLVVRMGL